MERDDLDLLEERLGYRFADRGLLAEAVTHRSFVAEASAESGAAENQRLEFLGDAALGLVSAEWLVAHRPEWQEGTLTKVRSRLTQEAALARVARRQGLGGFLRLGRGAELEGLREKPSVLADALEALLGAVWRDGGAEALRRVFEAWFAEELSEALDAGSEENPKGELQEWLQARQQERPRYEVLETSGPAHCPYFRVAVYLGEAAEALAEGTGWSRREAEMNAARAGLEKLG